MIKNLFRLVLITSLLLSFQFQAQAQQKGVCGTFSEADRAAITQRLLANKVAIKNGQVNNARNMITWVPIKFHLIARNDGTGRVTEKSVFDQLCNLNTEFADMDIQFFMYQGFNYIDHTVTYNTPSGSSGINRMNINKTPGVLNVFIPENAEPNGSGVGITLGYYQPFNDWIVIRKNQINLFNSTLSHEIGHYFSLLHPFNGWPAGGYNENTYGPQAPTFSPGNVRTENNARSGPCKNCDTAGDFICDTGADYNFGFTASNCEYRGNITDPCGEAVDPDEDNIMSYFEDCTDYYFSQEQIDVMRADLNQRLNGTTLNQNIQPTNPEPLGGPTTLEFPIDGEQISTFGYVTFNWSAVDNASGYLFEIDRTNAFSGGTQKFITDGSSSVQISGLTKNTFYFWRVTPYNEHSACVGSTTPERFRTGTMESTAVPTISSVNTWSVNPNPVQSGQNINIQLETQQAFEADITLYDIAGQAVQQIRQQAFRVGENSHQVNVEGLANGMYVLAIRSKEGVLNEKIVIAR